MRLRDSGMSPADISSVAISDGLNMVEIWNVLCVVFGLSFADAKEAWIQAKDGMSLDEYQALIPAIEAGLKEIDQASVHDNSK